MPQEKNYHMTMDQFRKYGREMVDWIADYYEKVENFPVMSQVQPGQVRAMLPKDPPEKGEEFGEIMKDLNRVILPGITHWQSPNFFAFFPANTSAPSILGELLSSGLGVQGMIWATSPSCTELETHVMDWMAGLLGLPEKFKSGGTGGGVIEDTASSACLCAILAARERATGYESNRIGCTGKLTAYISSQTHSSIEKGVKIAGIGLENLRVIAVDGNYAMDPAALEERIIKDKKDGLVPFFACASIGTTSSNAMDPVEEIGKICARHGIWLHVDAAMSGTAAICPEHRHINSGIDLADSYSFNPHKWMFTNFDCNCFYVADREPLIKALSILPEYLRNKATESGAVIDYRDWQIALGRRFRSLKLWFVIRHYGAEGLRHHVRRHIELAVAFAEWVRESADFELAAPAPLNLVCFRHRNGDDFNEELMNRLNRSGKIYLTHTKLGGAVTLRLCIGQTSTEMRHVEQAWKLIQETAAELANEKGK